MLDFAFDAFASDAQIEGPGEGGDTADNGRVLSVVAQAVDERAVNFERVDRETLEVTQARIASAEVVNGQPDADGLQGAQSRVGRFGILHDDTFGDLELQRARVQARIADSAGNVRDEVRMLQLARRQIHADTQRALKRVLGLPDPRL